MTLDEAFKVLNLKRNSSDEEIRKATKKLMAKFHPDRCKEKDAETKFKNIGEAKRVIDEWKSLGSPVEGNFSNYSYSSGVPRGSWSPGWNPGVNINDMFNDIFNARSSYPFTGQRQNYTYRKNPNVTMNVRLTFKEAILGTKKEIEYDRDTTCDNCFGIGKQTTSESCLICHGKGRITDHRTLGNMTVQQTVTCGTCRGTGKMMTPCDKCKSLGHTQEHVKRTVVIPPGVSDGNRAIENGGGHNLTGEMMSAGQLIITFSVDEDPDYVRENNDIHLIKKISLLDALKGKEIEVESLSGKKHKLKIPSSVKNSDVVIVSPDEGVPETEGSFCVRVFVDYPKSSKSVKKLIEILEKEARKSK